MFQPMAIIMCIKIAALSYIVHNICCVLDPVCSRKHINRIPIGHIPTQVLEGMRLRYESVGQ
jgi:hypothetical protein